MALLASAFLTQAQPNPNCVGRPEPFTGARFAVLSDPHLYDARLGTAGPDFEAYLDQDPKLLKESDAILDAAIDGILQQQVSFVLISGDLTKDGELRDHVRMTQHLARLEKQGIQVFVIPGNHDINNPGAVAYAANGVRPVSDVNPRLFQALYRPYGYGQALMRDSHTLSYVAEAAPGLWVMAFDTCKYDENRSAGTEVVGGHISTDTMNWIQQVMQTASERGKRVVAFMHHGVNQHFFGEAQLFPDFLLDDWASVSTQLAGAGLEVVFTGHYHSQDASYLLDSSFQILPSPCDIETGSLAQYPCAYRIVTVDSTSLQVESQRVTSIRADTAGLPFQDYALAFLADRLPHIVIDRLEAQFQLPPEQAAQVAPLVVDALLANYAGDEAPSPQVQQIIGGLLESPEPMHSLGVILWGLWTDLPPGDNELTLPFGQ